MKTTRGVTTHAHLLVGERKVVGGDETERRSRLVDVARLAGDALHAAEHFVSVGDYFQHLAAHVIVHHVAARRALFVHGRYNAGDRAKCLKDVFFYNLMFCYLLFI